jgi:hypothetical protein
MVQDSQAASPAVGVPQWFLRLPGSHLGLRSRTWGSSDESGRALGLALRGEQAQHGVCLCCPAPVRAPTHVSLCPHSEPLSHRETEQRSSCPRYVALLPGSSGLVTSEDGFQVLALSCGHLAFCWENQTVNIFSAP